MKFLKRKVLGRWRFTWPVLFGLFIALIVLEGAAFAKWAPQDSNWPAVIFWLSAVIGLSFVIVGGYQLTRRALIIRRHDAGLPEKVTVTCRLTAEFLDMEGETQITRIPWRYITELAEGNHHWLFIIATRGFFVPKLAFSDPEHQRTFLAQALTLMTEAARARSQPAVLKVGPLPAAIEATEPNL